MSRGRVHIANIGWGTTKSGSAAGGGSFLAVNSAGRLVLAAGGGGGVADVDIISGSSATYGVISGALGIHHRVSGSTGTFNFIDSDRITINQISGSTATINTISGSVGIIHNFSGSTGKFNSVDIDRVVTNQASGSTSNFNTNLGHVFSGSVATFHRMSGSTLISNFVDTDRITSGQMNTTSLTASYAKIISLDVQELVSRTVTKESLEIKDNLIIAGVSGSKAGNFVGAGFQIGGTVGIQGTGSSPLMSLTLGSRTLTGDSLIVNVDGQAGASFKSGSVTQAVLGTAGMRFGVTGSISGSLLQGKRAEIGSIGVGKVSGVILSATTLVSGATGNFATLNAGGKTTLHHTDINDSLEVAGYAGFASTMVVSGTFTGATISGSTGNFAALNAGGKTILHHTDINDSLEVAGYSGFAGTMEVSGNLSGSTATFFQMTLDKLLGTGIITHDNIQTGSIEHDHLNGAIITSDNLQTGSISTVHLGAKSVTKAKINEDIVQNNADAHGGLNYSSGRLSVGVRRRAFVRSDGSNISGSSPTKGMFATDAMPHPYTTASLEAVPQSGSMMVYLNGVLLHGEYDLGDTNNTGSSAPHADYRINSGSGTSNQYKIFMHEDLALDSDDILTVIYLSGSGVSS